MRASQKGGLLAALIVTLISFQPADLKVTDGDTFRAISGPYKGERVRLRTFNAPEMDEEGGPEAKAALQEWISNHEGPIECRQYARDRWARIIAECD